MRLRSKGAVWCKSREHASAKEFGVIHSIAECPVDHFDDEQVCRGALISLSVVVAGGRNWAVGGQCGRGV